LFKPGVAVVAVVLSVVLVGCAAGSGDENREGAEAPDPSKSSAPVTSESPTDTPTETESTPDVAPATGPVLKVAGLRVNAPKGWLTTIRVNAGHGAYPPASSPRG